MKIVRILPIINKNIKVYYYSFLLSVESDYDDKDADADYTPKNTSHYSKEIFDDLRFLEIIHSCGKDLLSKSQVPLVKKKKKDALQKVLDTCLSKYGVQYSEQQIKKKLENLKARVKAKTDRNKTGNKRIALNAADKFLLEMLGAENNPAINQLNCKLKYFQFFYYFQFQLFTNNAINYIQFFFKLEPFSEAIQALLDIKISHHYHLNRHESVLQKQPQHYKKPI